MNATPAVRMTIPSLTSGRASQYSETASASEPDGEAFGALLQRASAPAPDERTREEDPCDAGCTPAVPEAPPFWWPAHQPAADVVVSEGEPSGNSEPGSLAASSIGDGAKEHPAMNAGAKTAVAPMHLPPKTATGRPASLDWESLFAESGPSAGANTAPSNTPLATKPDSLARWHLLPMAANGMHPTADSRGPFAESAPSDRTNIAPVDNPSATKPESLARSPFLPMAATVMPAASGWESRFSGSDLSDHASIVPVDTALKTQPDSLPRLPSSDASAILTPATAVSNKDSRARIAIDAEFATTANATSLPVLATFEIPSIGNRARNQASGNLEASVAREGRSYAAKSDEPFEPLRDSQGALPTVIPKEPPRANAPALLATGGAETAVSAMQNSPQARSHEQESTVSIDSLKAVEATVNDPGLSSKDTDLKTTQSGAVSDLEVLRPQAVRAPLVMSLPAGNDAARAQSTDSVALAVTGKDAFVNDLTANLQWMSSQRISRADIQLNPVDLGQIDVTLSLSGEEVRAEFVSAHSDVRQALEAGMPKLREMFAGQGLQLLQADVGHRQTPDGHHSPTLASSHSEDTAIDGALISPSSPKGRPAAGLLDEFA